MESVIFMIHFQLDLWGETLRKRTVAQSCYTRGLSVLLQEVATFS